MKSKSLFSTLMLTAVLTAVCGCKKEETAPAPPPPKTSEAAPAGGTDLLNTATAAVTTTASNVANAASTVVTQAAAQAAAQVQAVTTAGTNLVNAAAAPVAQATTQAPAPVTAPAQPSQTMVQTVIDKAKGLVADQKYSDALNTLSQLANVKLTPEQQTLVDSLKSQIQTALAKTGASDATSALGGILGGKK